MAEERDDSQRTEQPTPRRLEEAHKKGDVVKSTEVSAFVLIGGGALAVALLGGAAARNFVGGFSAYLARPHEFSLDGAGALAILRGAALELALVLGPVLALIAAMAFLGNFLQHRPVFTAERIKPSLAKLSPLKGLKRIFGLDGVTNLLKGVLKLALVGAAAMVALWPERDRLAAVMTHSPAGIAGDMAILLLKMLGAALGVLALVAAFDYAYQRYRFLERHKMSRREIREELRQSEGDPQIKARIRQIRQERARKRMMAAVPQATVVVANPSHFAVALKYESGKMAAPVCVAKGVDSLALRIRKVAEDHEVPVVENPPLARALYSAVEIGAPIPPAHYKAVARIIGYVMGLRHRAAPA